jgi:hypothetical protein
LFNNSRTALFGKCVMPSHSEKRRKACSEVNPKIDPAPNSNTEKNPDEWVSGDAPIYRRPGVVPQNPVNWLPVGSDWPTTPESSARAPLAHRFINAALLVSIPRQSRGL